MHEQAAWLCDDRDVRAVFYLGAVGPDARIVSGQRREETHFFDIPVAEGAPPAQEVMACPLAGATLSLYPVRVDSRIALRGGDYITHLVIGSNLGGD